MDHEEFRMTYHNYEIEVVPEESRFFPKPIKLREWMVMPFADRKDTFLVDGGGWQDSAFPMRVDFETNTCYWNDNFDESELRLLGTLKKVQNEEPA